MESLFRVNTDVTCVNCGHKGAIQFYGQYYNCGLGDYIDKMSEFSKSIMEKSIVIIHI